MDLNYPSRVRIVEMYTSLFYTEFTLNSEFVFYFVKALFNMLKLTSDLLDVDSIKCTVWVYLLKKQEKIYM